MSNCYSALKAHWRIEAQVVEYIPGKIPGGMIPVAMDDRAEEGLVL